MAGKITQNNNNTILEFEWEALTDKPGETLKAATHILFERGLGDHGSEDAPIIWEDLTVQDYLDILDVYLKMTILGLAAEDVRNFMISQTSLDVAAKIQSTHGLE